VIEEVPFVEDAYYYINPLKQSITQQQYKTPKTSLVSGHDYFSILKNKKIIKE